MIIYYEKKIHSNFRKNRDRGNYFRTFLLGVSNII